ncbi:MULTISPECIES: STAS domain-containing protein [Micromonospora]|uniref:STAS domain-containing protein n=1 Tax=Micromonospora antibiotica TaxID=2807623 RepID=A0ABS3V563_9ACTN|nr:STAS domain-containing protein [Micromonospora antibiotica]MBO4160719.1 STAS domain-containing protein [Micromonospora antibiotica]
MRPQLLSIEVTRPDAGHARLRLTGDLDFDTAPELLDAAARVRADGCHELTVDLGGVGLCDSSGLSAFLVLSRGGVGPLRLTGVGDRLQQLLDRTGLTELLAVERPTAGAADDVREVG